MALSHHIGTITEPAILPQVNWLDSLSPQDAKISQMGQFIIESPVSNCFTGVVASFLTKNPLPFLLGLGDCFSTALAQQVVVSEFQVNSNTTGNQEAPSVTALIDGNFIVTWQDGSGLDGDSYGVFGQIFNETNGKIGNEFQVHSNRDGNQVAPSVAPLADGYFVVAWQDGFGFDGSSHGIFGQIFDNFGGKAGGEFQVNTYTMGTQSDPYATVLKSGNIVIVWNDRNGQDGNEAGIYGQIFSSSAVQIGTEFQVHTRTAGIQSEPSIAGLDQDGFVVAWTNENTLEVSYQIFNPAGTPVFGELPVSANATGIQSNPSVAGLKNDNFVIAWQDQDVDGFGIHGQVFNPFGGRVGSEFQVNTYTIGNQRNPAVTALNSSNFVVVWESDSAQDGNLAGVFGQMFDPLGGKIGNEFQVNAHTAGNQNNPSIDVLSTSDFVVAWQDGSGQDGSLSGIFGQIFDQSRPVSADTTGMPIVTTGNVTTGSASSTSGSSTGTTGTSTSTSTTTSTSSQSTGEVVSPSSSSSNPSLLGPLLGAAAGVTCLAVTGFALIKLRDKSHHSSEEELDESPGVRSSISAERKDKGHTEIGGKYALINKISLDEARILLDQTGIEVAFPPGKNKAKILLGEGNFGKLRIARSLETGLFAGVKKVKGEEAIQASQDEGILQAKLEGKPNIMPIWDYVESVSSSGEPVLYQFMPVAGFGNGEELRAHLNATEFVDPRLLTHVAQGVARGLDHMHDAGIYHLDIKLSNLVLNMMGEVFVIDFGCAKEFEDGRIYGAPVGDTRYFSPERLNISRQRAQGGVVDPIAADKVDAWAFGVAMLELATGNYPFDYCDMMEKYRTWNADYFQMKLDGIEFLKCPGGLNEVVKGLLDVNPDTRLSLKEACDRLSQLQGFSGEDEQKAFFASLKKETICETREPEARGENENYEDVYQRKHDVGIEDYQAV